MAAVAKEIADLVEPILEGIGFELVEVEYLSERGRWILRLYVDKEGGVSVDDCARVSREVGDVIDVKDIIRHGHVLEVSSPGLHRPLRKEKDFLGAVGKKVKLMTAEPMEGRRNFKGRLRAFHEGTLTLETEEGVKDLLLENVERANLVYEFEARGAKKASE